MKVWGKVSLISAMSLLLVCVAVQGSSANASESDNESPTSLWDIEDGNEIFYDSDNYKMYDTGESGSILYQNTRDKREIATFVDKWYYMNYTFSNGKPVPKVTKRWYVEYNKGWKFQGWLHWTGEYGTIGRYQTNFKYSGKLVKVN